MIEQNKDLFKIDSRQGKQLAMAEGAYRIIISGNQTEGAFALIEMQIQPGAGPVPHAHQNFEETYYVIEGEVNFSSENEMVVAKKGDSVVVPKGTGVHQFKNKGQTPAKMLCTVIPAGLEEYYIEVSDVMTGNDSESSEPVFTDTLDGIAVKYGLQLFPPDYFDKHVKSA